MASVQMHSTSAQLVLDAQDQDEDWETRGQLKLEA